MFDFGRLKFKDIHSRSSNEIYLRSNREEKLDERAVNVDYSQLTQSKPFLRRLTESSEDISHCTDELSFCEQFLVASTNRIVQCERNLFGKLVKDHCPESCDNCASISASTGNSFPIVAPKTLDTNFFFSKGNSFQHQVVEIFDEHTAYAISIAALGAALILGTSLLLLKKVRSRSKLSEPESITIASKLSGVKNTESIDNVSTVSSNISDSSKESKKNNVSTNKDPEDKDIRNSGDQSNTLSAPLNQETSSLHTVSTLMSTLSRVVSWDNGETSIFNAYNEFIVGNNKTLTNLNDTGSVSNNTRNSSSLESKILTENLSLTRSQSSSTGKRDSTKHEGLNVNEFMKSRRLGNKLPSENKNSEAFENADSNFTKDLNIVRSYNESRKLQSERGGSTISTKNNNTLTEMSTPTMSGKSKLPKNKKIASQPSSENEIIVEPKSTKKLENSLVINNNGALDKNAAKDAAIHLNKVKSLNESRTNLQNNRNVSTSKNQSKLSLETKSEIIDMRQETLPKGDKTPVKGNDYPENSNPGDMLSNIRTVFTLDALEDIKSTINDTFSMYSIPESQPKLGCFNVTDDVESAHWETTTHPDLKSFTSAEPYLTKETNSSRNKRIFNRIICSADDNDSIESEYTGEGNTRKVLTNVYSDDSHSLMSNYRPHWVSTAQSSDTTYYKPHRDYRLNRALSTQSNDTSWYRPNMLLSAKSSGTHDTFSPGIGCYRTDTNGLSSDEDAQVNICFRPRKSN